MSTEKDDDGRAPTRRGEQEDQGGHACIAGKVCHKSEVSLAEIRTEGGGVDGWGVSQERRVISARLSPTVSKQRPDQQRRTSTSG